MILKIVIHKLSTTPAAGRLFVKPTRRLHLHSVGVDFTRLNQVGVELYHTSEVLRAVAIGDGLHVVIGYCYIHFIFSYLVVCKSILYH
jgi:hypothetical protein